MCSFLIIIILVAHDVQKNVCVYVCVLNLIWNLVA